MGYVDLHMHSVYSDGSKTPYELIQLGRRIGLKTMALTDHDAILGSKEFVQYTDMGIYLYSGVELTAKVDKGRMHILGYNIDLENEDLNCTLQKMKEASIYNFLLYVEVLRKKYNLDIPQEMIDEILSAKGNIGRPQLALLLIQLGYCHDVEEAFARYLVPAYERVRKVKKGLTKEECISLIRNAGGVVSLAHPVSLKMEKEELEREIAYLKSVGLDCIEVIHIHNDEKDRQFFHQLAMK